MEPCPTENAWYSSLCGRMVSFDVETTDFPHLSTTRVIEIAGVELQDGHLSGKCFASYVACDEPSVPGAFEKHHLSIDWLMLHGRPVEEVLRDFLDFAGDAPLLCHGRYHGVNCDEEVVNNELQRLSLPKLTNCIIQTTDLFGFVTLRRLCDHFAVPSAGAHGALRDAEMLAECFLKFQQTGFPPGLPVAGATIGLQLSSYGVPWCSSTEQSWQSPWPSSFEGQWQDAGFGQSHGSEDPQQMQQSIMTREPHHYHALMLPSRDVHALPPSCTFDKLTPLQRQVLAQLNDKERM